MYDFLVLGCDVAVMQSQNLWDGDSTAEVLGDSEVQLGWIRVGEIVEAQRRLVAKNAGRPIASVT